MIRIGYMQKTNNGYGGLLATLIFFIINPTLGLIMSLLIAINSNNDYDNNHRDLITFMIITAAWISLINITKSISGDQGVYTRIFLSVPEVGFKGTVFNAWGGSGKEPVFSLITWLLYWLTFGSVRLYYFIISFAIYIFHYLAAYKLFKKMDIPKGALICGVLILTFFTQYFVMTLQIIRQVLAGAIVIYALVYRAVEGRNNWIFLATAVLIHTSAVFIALLSLVPWFYSWMNIKRIVVVLGCFIPFIVFNGIIGNLFGGSTGINALDYGLSMYGNTGYSDGGTMALSVMLFIFIPLMVVAGKILFKYRHDYIVEDDFEKMRMETILPIVYICILLLIFVMSFTKSPLIQYRFFYYSYSFIPLLLPVLFEKYPWSKPYWALSSTFFIFRFFMTHNESGWIYASVFDILSNSIYYFWTGNFHWMYLV